MRAILGIDPPDDDFDHWTVSSDLRKPGSGFSDDANYEAQDTFKSQFPDVEFDCEESCFFAYSKDAETAQRLVDTLTAWVEKREAQ